MTVEKNTMYPHQLHKIKQLYYDPSGAVISQFEANPESKEYQACSFLLNNKKVIYRQAKITPTKTGQFVTIWKRNAAGITAPFDSEDAIDFFIITVQDNELLGQFIFPREVLSAKGIITHNNKGGKRGMRVYPPWNTVTSKQALVTQNWQAAYFYELLPEGTTVMDRIITLF